MLVKRVKIGDNCVGLSLGANFSIFANFDIFVYDFRESQYSFAMSSRVVL